MKDSNNWDYSEADGERSHLSNTKYGGVSMAHHSFNQQLEAGRDQSYNQYQNYWDEQAPQQPTEMDNSMWYNDS
jgi:hypothetical protein